MKRTTTLQITEEQTRSLLAAVRNKIEDYEGDLNDLEPGENEEARRWYEARLAELRPLEQRLNAAGLRLKGQRS